MSYKELIQSSTGNVDLKLFDKFINTAMTSTLQEEFYIEKEQKDEQVQKVLKIHKEVLEKNRNVYALSALLPINDIHKTAIIHNLIRDINVEDKYSENNIILDTLKRMPVTRAYKTFYVLMKSKINNTRFKWLARQYIRERGDRILQDVVKYKRLLKPITKHCHIDYKKICKIEGKEDIERFLFEKEKSKIKNELFKNYFKARKDKKAVFKLPYSIAEGFKNLHKISDKEFMEKMEDKMTHGEKRRAQARAEKSGVKIEVDLSKESPLNIQKMLRADAELKTVRKTALDDFEKACKKQAKRLYDYFDFKNIKIIVDNSLSMSGSKEKKNHPIAVAESVANVLKYLSKETEIVGAPNKAKFLMNAEGETDLSVALLKILKEIDTEKENLLIVISDGFENAPAGLSNQILVTYKKKIDKKNKVLIIHLNPVYSLEAENIKTLSDVAHTFGVRDTRQLFLILLLAVIRNKKNEKVKQFLDKLKEQITVRQKIKRKKKVKVKR